MWFHDNFDDHWAVVVRNRSSTIVGPVPNDLQIAAAASSVTVSSSSASSNWDELVVRGLDVRWQSNDLGLLIFATTLMMMINLVLEHDHGEPAAAEWATTALESSASGVWQQHIRALQQPALHSMEISVFFCLLDLREINFDGECRNAKQKLLFCQF